MKKNYLIAFCLLFTTGLFAQMGQIQNGGFENWSNQNLYEYPTQWGNSNIFEWQGVPTTIKSTDVAAGSFSVELIASDAVPSADTVFGFVFHGTIGQTGPDGGIAYTDAFDEVRFQYNCDLAAGDTLYMIYIRFVGGTMVEMNVLPAAFGTSGSWTQGSISVPSTPQDELFIGFVLSNPMGGPAPIPGSWARIDEVELRNLGTAVSAVPDPGFEQWSTQTIENPDNWYTLNELLAGSGMENAIKSIDANSGTYAIEMTNYQDPMSGDTISSFISMGPFAFGTMNPFLPVPYNATPTSFSGAYKYSPQGGDQASIQIIFMQAGTPIGSHLEPLSSAATYTPFTSALTIAGTPDSIVFVAFTGDNPGSVLKLDDLMFSGGDVSLAEFEKMAVALYPNPAKELVYVKAEGNYLVRILDLAGKTVLTKSNLSGAHALHIEALSRGAYIVRIEGGTQTKSLRLIKE